MIASEPAAAPGTPGPGHTEPATGRPPPRAPLSDACLPPADLSREPWPCRPLPAGSVTVQARIAPGPGTGGRTVVYVHGLGGSATNWTDLAAQLADHATGIAVDLPGFGGSPPPAGYRYTPLAQSDVVIAVIEGLDAGPVDLAGNSMGGLITAIVAARRPDLVRTLILVSPAVPDLRPDPRRMADPRLLLTGFPVIGGRVRRRIAAESTADRVDRVLRLCFARPERVPAQRREQLVAEAAELERQGWSGPALVRAGWELFRAWLTIGAASPWQQLRQVVAPTLVVWGDQDRLVSVRKAVPTVRALPRGRLLVLNHTGHVAQMERPQLVARAMLGMWHAVEDGLW